MWIVTKNALVTRDIDLLSELAKYGACHVSMSVTSLDNSLCQILEPRTSRPGARLAAIEKLAAAGIPVGVNVAPIIPSINESEIPSILKAARSAGATSACYVPVRLPFAVKDLFASWLESHFPDRKEKVLSRIRQMRDGKLNDPTFGSRMRGAGPLADHLSSFFRVSARRAGFEERRTKLSLDAFVKPSRTGDQLALF